MFCYNVMFKKNKEICYCLCYCLCCCSQTAKYKRCVDTLLCTKSDPLYQLYLSHVGSANSYSYLCQNDTLKGCIYHHSTKTFRNFSVSLVCIHSNITEAARQCSSTLMTTSYRQRSREEALRSNIIGDYLRRFCSFRLRRIVTQLSVPDTSTLTHSVTIQSEEVNFLSCTELNQPEHVLHSLLPPPSASQYNLRDRPHNSLLCQRASRLTDCNFIITVLYSDMQAY